MQRQAHPKRSSKAPARPVFGYATVAVAFFLLCFLYAGLRLEPALQYHRQTPVFFSNFSFFTKFLGRPGGLLEHAAAFLAQLNYFNWLGALVATLLAGGIFLAIRRLLKQITGAAPAIAPFGPPFLLLLLWNGQHGFFPDISAGLLLALALALAYLLLPWPQAWFRLAACWLLAGSLSFAAGLWPGLLMAVIGGLHEIKQRRKWLVGCGCILPVPLMFLGLIFFRDADPAKLLNPWGVGTPLLLAIALYLYLPLAAITLMLLPPPPAPPPKGVPPARHVPPAPRLARLRLRFGLMKRGLAAGLFLLGWALVWFVFDGQKQAEARMDYYTSHGEYEKALTAAAKLKTLNAPSEVRLHLALYHTGRLAQDLFSFTNQTVWSLMPAFSEGLAICRPQSETLFELGQVGMAEHFAHEALELEGERPDLLRLLARINILKDRPEAARVFLNVLRQIPFQQQWAADTLRSLEANPRLPDDHLLAGIRSRMASADLVHSAVPIEAVLRQLLRANPQNRMAFEYLMAHYLLNLQMDKLVKELAQLDNFGVTGIPRHYEEAILMHQRLQGGAEIDLRGRRIRPETRQRFQEFIEAVNRRALDSVEGRKLFARDFGDTFWHYYLDKLPAMKESASQPAKSP